MVGSASTSRPSAVRPSSRPAHRVTASSTTMSVSSIYNKRAMPSLESSLENRAVEAHGSSSTMKTCCRRPWLTVRFTQRYQSPPSSRRPLLLIRAVRSTRYGLSEQPEHAQERQLVLIGWAFHDLPQ